MTKLTRIKFQARLTESERVALEELTEIAGVNYAEFLRRNIQLYAPYLIVQGCMDNQYIDALRRAIVSPNPLNFQLLDNERGDIMHNEQDALMRFALYHQGLDTRDVPKYEPIRDRV